MIHLAKAEKKEDVLPILTDKEIFGRISEDGHDLSEFELPFDGTQCYMLIMIDDLIIGVWCLYPQNKSTMIIHCNILKPYRQHGKEAGRLLVEWFAEECPSQYFKLNAEIPVIYPDVYHFTKKFGFVDEGVNRASVLKYGKLVDQWRLGLTRDEARQFMMRVS